MSIDMAVQRGNTVVVKCSNPNRTTTFAGILVNWTPTTVTVKDRFNNYIYVYDENHRCLSKGSM